MSEVDMLIKDPVEIKKIFLKELQGMSEEAILTQARMFNVPVTASLKRDAKVSKSASQKKAK